MNTTGAVFTWALRQFPVYLLVILVLSFLYEFLLRPRYPRGIPQVGHGAGLLGFIRNYLAFNSRQSWILDGYVKYGKKGAAFILPLPLSCNYEVVLPRAQIGWVMDQPDSTLSAYEAHKKSLFYGYNFLDHNLAEESFANRVMHKFAARHVVPMLSSLGEEVDFAMSKALGHVSNEWTSVNLWNLWMEVVPITTSRFLAGTETCRDEILGESIVNFANSVMRTRLVLSTIPRPLHPMVGPLVTIPNRRHWKTMCQVIMPLIEERMHSMTKKAQGCSEYQDYAPPEDYITWVIRLIFAENRTAELDPILVSKRLLPVIFASIHTTVITCHTWILDLLSTAPKDNILESLRNEIEDNMPVSGVWTKAELMSLTKVDSSIRESQRLTPIASTLIQREVVAPEGLHHPDAGWTLSKGTSITVHTQGIQHDEDLFDDPLTYKPFRYSSMRNTQPRESSNDGFKDSGRYEMITTSDQHFPFGHGRHACPGRLFVSHEMKLFLVHLLTHFDIRALDQRPQQRYFGLAPIPPMEVRIELRRR